MTYSAKILADSIARDVRLTTFEYLERAFSTARSVCDRAAAANPTGSAYAVAKVAEAWGLPEALADCIGAIQANSSSNALRHLNNHIIDILTTAVSQKETPAP